MEALIEAIASVVIVAITFAFAASPYIDCSAHMEGSIITDTEPHMLSLYEEMKLRDVDLSWYDKRKRPKAAGPIPLNDDRCSRLSIYLLKQDGSLWTVKFDGEAYSQVRKASRNVPPAVYICIHCKAQWSAMPQEHKEGDSWTLRILNYAKSCTS